MSLLRFCQWLEETSLSVAIRESSWGFPIIESVHVVGLCLFGMAILVDLRVLNVTLKRVPVSEVTTQLLPWVTARLRDGGHIHYFAGGEGPTLPLPLADLYHRELTISSTYSSSPTELREAFDLLATGKVRVDGLITHRLPLGELAQGVELMRRHEAVKVYITP